MGRALKTGGMEVSRERWDEEEPEGEAGEGAAAAAGVIPDWTRAPLPVGAPAAGGSGAPPNIAIVGPSPARAAVVGA